MNPLAFSKPTPDSSSSGTSLDLSPLAALAGDPALLIGTLDRLLLHGTMSSVMKTAY